MATTAEKRALAFLAALAALGITVRAIRSSKEMPGTRDRAALDRQIAAVDSATSRRFDRAPGPKSRAKSRRHEDDSSRIGAPHEVPRAELRGRPLRPADSGITLSPYEQRRRAVYSSNAEARARIAERNALLEAPQIAAPQPSSKPAPDRRISSRPIDLDTADEEAIATIPGIGPSLASRIVSDRARRGAFGSLQALQRVAGVGPGLASRIALHVTFSRPAMGVTTVIPWRKSRR